MNSDSSAGRPPRKNITRQACRGACVNRVDHAERQRREEIAQRVAFLQQARQQAAQPGDADSSASDAPTPHSPPMPMPNSRRRMTNVV
jgi:hypothetical protein